MKLEEIFYGVIADIRRAAHELAEINKVKHNFNNDKKMAGKDGFTCLCNVLLEKVVNQNHLDATNIYNVDEIGLPVYRKKAKT